MSKKCNCMVCGKFMAVDEDREIRTLCEKCHKKTNKLQMYFNHKISHLLYLINVKSSEEHDMVNKLKEENKEHKQNIFKMLDEIDELKEKAKKGFWRYVLEGLVIGFALVQAIQVLLLLKGWV